jgi:hypothetical protein
MTGASDKFTMSGWVKFITISTTAYPVVIGCEDADTVAILSPAVALDPNNDVGIQGYAESEFELDAFAPQPSTGTWYYFYVICQNNGSGFVTTTGGYYTAAGATPEDTGSIGARADEDMVRVSIGADSYGDEVDCHIAHVRLWTGVALTGTELKAERDSATAVKATGLWADWPLADNTDNGDDSGNGRDLTLGLNLTTESGPFDTPAASVAAGSSLLML